MSDFGVVPTGFNRKDYPQILQDMQSRARATFGGSINVDTNKPFGKILDIVGWELSELWDNLENLYHAISIDSAENVELDRLVKYRGITRLIERAGRGQIQITGTMNTFIPLNFIVGKINGVTYNTMDSGTITETGLILLPITANVTGSKGNAEIGEINLIITPITGVTSVTNISPIFNGADFESDIELRERFLQTTSGLSTLDAIGSAVSALDGVVSVIPIENITMGYIDGQPPKSVQVFIYGGEDTKIAQTILDTKAAGIEAFGTTYEKAYDRNGFDHDIGFTRASTVDIYVRVTVKINQFYTVGAADRIRENILMYIGGQMPDGTTFSGLKIGQPVINNYILSLVWPVGGMTDVLVEISDDNITFSETNIILGKFEIARTSFPDIEVIES